MTRAVVFVAVTRQTPSRTIEDTEIRFVTVGSRKFVGAKDYEIYGRKARISDPEKTAIDCIDRPDLAGGAAELTRIVHAAMAQVDPEKLVLAAMQMKSTSLLQRLGFLTDLVDRPLSKELKTRLREAIPRSARSTFGRRDRKDGDVGYVADWGVFVRARRSDLLSEVPRIRTPDK